MRSTIGSGTTFSRLVRWRGRRSLNTNSTSASSSFGALGDLARLAAADQRRGIDVRQASAPSRRRRSTPAAFASATNSASSGAERSLRIVQVDRDHQRPLRSGFGGVESAVVGVHARAAPQSGDQPSEAVVVARARAFEDRRRLGSMNTRWLRHRAQCVPRAAGPDDVGEVDIGIDDEHVGLARDQRLGAVRVRTARRRRRPRCVRPPARSGSRCTNPCRP